MLQISFATLNKYRHVAYKRDIASTSLSISFQLSRIRPTRAAARQHPFRVYFQIQEWMGPGISLLRLSGDGKIISDYSFHGYKPTISSTATDEHRHWLCRTGSGNACRCREARMVFSDKCFNCMGVSCDNAPEMDFDNQ